MKKTLAIVGSGHLGQQIAHYAIVDKHFDDIVFFDDFTAEKTVNGYRVIGKSDRIDDEFAKHTFDQIIIGIGYKHLDVKKKIYEKLKETIPFATIIHSSAWVDSTAKIGSGTIIYPSSNIDANAIIGENVVVNIAATIAHDSVIENHCFISPRAAIAGFVTIEEQCIIGINATIIDNIRIVAQTQIGGGTVVVKNIEKSGLYAGNPSRWIR